MIFEGRMVDRNDLENAYKIHFTINLANGKTLIFAESNEVKDSDFVTRYDCITTVMRLWGGWDERIEEVLMLFINRDRNYPIDDDLSTVDCVSYLTGPKPEL